MSERSCNYLALGFLLTVTLNNISIPALANPATVTSPKTILRVYNYASVPPKVLARAEEETTIIFGEAGVLTLWLDCPISMAEFDRYPACQQPSGPADLILRILPRSMAEREPSDDSTLGFALPGRPGMPGRIANVFYHRVREVAWRGQYFEFQILGNAMAHEIGHLLLGSMNHSPTGIMKAKWNRMELHPTSLGFLQFTSEQAALMRHEVVSRIKHPDFIQDGGRVNPGLVMVGKDP